MKMARNKALALRRELAALRGETELLRRFLVDARLILHALLIGAAHFEPSTREFVYAGLRYSVADEQWVTLAALVTRERLADAHKYVT
jgi:hypothetical protein